MKQLTLLSLTLLVSAALGCGPSRPDPRANPDFNENARANPGEVKMGK